MTNGRLGPHCSARFGTEADRLGGRGDVPPGPRTRVSHALRSMRVTVRARDPRFGHRQGSHLGLRAFLHVDDRVDMCITAI